MVSLVPTNGGTQTMTVQYRCIVNNALGYATSAVSTVSVLPVLPPTTTLDTFPGTNMYCFNGANLSLQGAFSGAMPMTNMWQRRINVSGFANLGATASNVLTLASNDLNAYYTVTNITSGMNGYAYRVMCGNVCGYGSNTSHMDSLHGRSVAADELSLRQLRFHKYPGGLLAVSGKKPYFLAYQHYGL